MKAHYIAEQMWKSVSIHFLAFSGCVLWRFWGLHFIDNSIIKNHTNKMKRYKLMEFTRLQVEIHCLSTYLRKRNCRQQQQVQIPTYKAFREQRERNCLISEIIYFYFQQRFSVKNDLFNIFRSEATFCTQCMCTTDDV